MPIKEYKLVRNPVYGYKRLDPIPLDEEIKEFYKKRYYGSLQAHKRFPQHERFKKGGEAARRELSWLHNTLHSDVLHIIKQYMTPGKKVLDLGCGAGGLVDYLAKKGLPVVGVEPSEEAAQIARSKGVTVYNTSLDEFVTSRKKGAEPFGAIILIDVFQHLPKAAEQNLTLIKQLLAPGGIVCLQVSNDFNAFQLAAQRRRNKKKPWWIAIPDHIHYFDFDSLHALLKDFGFDIVYSQGDFPMELFLLMGEDYVEDQKVGSECHKKRVSFEMSLDPELRRSFYRTLGAAGLGRKCFVVGKLKKK